MRAKLTKANAFEIDPTKKYLVVVGGADTWAQVDKVTMQKKISAYMPNVAIMFTPAIAKYKVMEAPANENNN